MSLRKRTKATTKGQLKRITFKPALLPVLSANEQGEVRNLLHACATEARRTNLKEGEGKVQLVRGLSAVTRTLERGDLCVVVATVHGKLKALLRHLPELAGAKRIPMIMLNCTPHELGHVVGLRRTLAVGLRSSAEPKDRPEPLTELLTHASIPHVPWINDSSGLKKECVFVPATVDKKREETQTAAPRE